MATASVTTQQMEFVSKVLPSLFHSTPGDFLLYLSQDGNKFLRFYWDQAGTNQHVAERVPPLGLNYDIRKPDTNATIVLIILSKPRVFFEAYYVALIYRPLRRTMFWDVSDTTKVVALELAPDPEGKLATRLREWSHQLKGEVISNGPEPSLEIFYNMVTDLIR